MSAFTKDIVIEPRRRRWLAEMADVWRYRELLYFLTKRDIKVRYRQTVLGAAWAVLQPFVTMVVFSIFFGRLAKMPSEGVPYPIFVFAGLVPWTYFANAITTSGNSLVGNTNLITKVYFPRLIIPISGCMGGLLDLCIASLVLGGMMAYYHYVPSASILLLPLLIGLTFLAAMGVGLWLSALNVKYRDIRYTIPFLVQVWLFVTPVIYPVDLAGRKHQWLFALNPMGGVIDAFRAAMLGHTPVDWTMLGISTAIIMVICISGVVVFKGMERQFADII